MAGGDDDKGIANNIDVTFDKGSGTNLQDRTFHFQAFSYREESLGPGMGV